MEKIHPEKMQSNPKYDNSSENIEAKEINKQYF